MNIPGICRGYSIYEIAFVVSTYVNGNKIEEIGIMNDTIGEIVVIKSNNGDVIVLG